MGLNDNLSERAKEDMALVIKARAGDQHAFSILMGRYKDSINYMSVSYTHLRAHETVLDLVCRLLLEKKNKQKNIKRINLNNIS